MLLPVNYTGDYPALYAQAVTCLLNINDFHSHGQSVINIIDEDDYGRKLFYYNEDQCFLLINQKSDDTYTYYYSDYSFLVLGTGYNLDSLDDKEIDNLKEANDWGEELNENKLIKKKIINQKQEIPIEIPDTIYEGVLKDLAASKGYKGTDALFRSACFFSQDRNFQSIICVWGVGRDYDGTGVNKDSKDMYLSLLIIFQQDGSFDENTGIHELTDTENYQEELKLFKQNNNWQEAE